MSGEYFAAFQNLTGRQPFPWQERLGQDGIFRNRLIRVPTGFGKTHGVFGAWFYHRVLRQRSDWPLRLVWCLPMRVLVEQTEAELRRLVGPLVWDGRGDHSGKLGIHLLMGGSDSGEWHLHPECPAVLIGTQDMLLSRALNRGYASPRARWPMEFGLLNQDCLWVMDEVQLMDVGLATSAQLQVFRDQTSPGTGRPVATWWMSATLQPDWLRKSPDTDGLGSSLGEELKKGSVAIQAAERKEELWESRKPCRLEPPCETKEVAALVLREHGREDNGARGPTLVVLNTVERAVQVAEHLRKSSSSDVRLLHSRFRPHERARWKEVLNREACSAPIDRILVATQVIEAGVDVSGAALVTELAPWPSLVQRFGRAARWGGAANVVVLDLDVKKAPPYDPESLAAARKALNLIQDVAPLHLERFEELHRDLLGELYPYQPLHLLLRKEVDDLFDTTADLSGSDVDISRFIRTGEDRDVLLFWREVSRGSAPTDEVRAGRQELCPAPFLSVKEWMGSTKGMRAWTWDWLQGRWRGARREDVWPGQTLLVDASCGGYDPERGWVPSFTGRVHPVPIAMPEASGDDAQDDESLSETDWKTIATHGREVGSAARAIALALAPEVSDIFDLAGRWHDAGKSHAAFQGSILRGARESLARRTDLAKAPKDAWLRGRRLYPVPGGGRRSGFRHELASTLAMFSVLRRHDPRHAAMLGPWIELLATAGRKAELQTSSTEGPNALEEELLRLGREEFDLVAYLVCSHHGKVRMTWHASPADQESEDSVLRIRGIREGDVLPSFKLADGAGLAHPLPQSVLTLSPSAAGLDASTGPGWTERTLALLAKHGPFRLAWLEACFRAADVRASRLPTADPLLKDEGPGSPDDKEQR